MNEPNRKRVGWKSPILALMLASAFFSIWLDIQRRFISPGAIEATRRFVTTDQTLADAGRAGPVGLQFLNSDSAARQFAYRRAVYDLYPAPVVIVNNDVVVFDVDQVPDGIIHSQTWWRQRGVKTVVTIDPSKKSWEAESVPATNPSRPE